MRIKASYGEGLWGSGERWKGYANGWVAERQGFEPWEALPSLVFKTSAFDRSATSPATVILFALCGPIKTASDIRPTFA